MLRRRGLLGTTNTNARFGISCLISTQCAVSARRPLTCAHTHAPAAAEPTAAAAALSAGKTWSNANICPPAAAGGTTPPCDRQIPPTHIDRFKYTHQSAKVSTTHKHTHTHTLKVSKCKLHTHTLKKQHVSKKHVMNLEDDNSITQHVKRGQARGWPRADGQAGRTKPASQPASKPASKPARKKAGQQTSQPAGLPFRLSARHPASLAYYIQCGGGRGVHNTADHQARLVGGHVALSIHAPRSVDTEQRCRYHHRPHLKDNLHLSQPPPPPPAPPSNNSLPLPHDDDEADQQASSRNQPNVEESTTTWAPTHQVLADATAESCLPPLPQPLDFILRFFVKLVLPRKRQKISRCNFGTKGIYTL